MSTLNTTSFSRFLAGDQSRADVDLLCELFYSESDVCLDVDGHRITLPPAVRAVLARVIDHLRRGDDIRRSLTQVPAETLLQPVVELENRRTVGYEALADLPARGLPGTEAWLRDGARFGLVEEFEVGAVELALEELARVPESAYLSVNVSPATIASGRLDEMLAGVAVDRLVLEMTEHAPVDDYAVIDSALAALRRRGLRLAVDDAGAGFSSFQHILRVHPELVKLDISLIRGVDADAGRRALVSGLVHFAAEIGVTTVAEGVETEAQAQVVRDLGVGHAQGWLFGAARHDLDGPVKVTGRRARR